MLSLQPVINIKILLSYYIYIICSVIIFLMCTKSLKSIFSMYSPSHFGFITTFRMPSHMWLVAVMLDKCGCNRCMWEGDTPQTQSNIQTEDFTGGPVVKTSPCNAGVQVQSQDGRAKIPHAFWPKNRNIIQKQYCNKFNKDFKNGPPKVLKKKIQASCEPTSPVIQWLRICLPMQGTWVRSLVWEDFKCLEAAKPVGHDYWSPSFRAQEPQLEKARVQHRRPSTAINK